MRSREGSDLVGLLALATAFIAPAACASPAPVTKPFHLTDVIDAILRERAIEPSAVERALRVRLVRDGESGGPFTFYTASLRAGDVVLEVDMRQPDRSRGASAGSLLNLRVTAGCPKRSEIESRYRPLHVFDLPHGRSPDETVTLGRQERWGRLTFGFSERSPDCLAIVTFSEGSDQSEVV